MILKRNFYLKNTLLYISLFLYKNNPGRTSFPQQSVRWCCKPLSKYSKININQRFAVLQNQIYCVFVHVFCFFEYFLVSKFGSDYRDVNRLNRILLSLISVMEKSLYARENLLLCRRTTFFLFLRYMFKFDIFASLLPFLDPLHQYMLNYYIFKVGDVDSSNSSGNSEINCFPITKAMLPYWNLRFRFHV